MTIGQVLTLGATASRPRRLALPGSGVRSANWLVGLAVNLTLSLLYLLVDPLSDQPHRDWAILVGSYFAVFLLADVVTTNALGADAQRVRHHLRAGVPLRRILVTKNLSLLAAVGAPVLVATALITLHQEATSLLAVTLPAVLLPMLIWLGIGNLVSVLLPVAAVPLRQRWRQRRDLRANGPWLVAIALPYALCFAVDSMSTLPRVVLHALGHVRFESLAVPAAVLLISGLAVYGLATGAALHVARRRVFRFAASPVAEA